MSNPNNTPALQPPEGIQPNFVDPPTLMMPVTIGCIFVLSVLTVLVAVRTFTKMHIMRDFHTEDYFSLLACAGITTYTGLFLYNASIGFARHQWDNTLTMYSRDIYWLNIMYIMYGPSTLFAKLSVLYQIKHIFTATRKGAVYWVVQVSIVANIIFYMGLFFSFVFQCWPREAIWNPEVKGVCTNPIQSDFAAGILNMASDVEALILPGWAIWHLKMPVQRKLGVFAVFAVGMLAIIIGAVGLYWRIVLLESPDYTWTCTGAAMLVIAEMAVVTIVGCVPSLPRFWRFCSSGFKRDTPTVLSYSASKKSGFNRSNKMGQSTTESQTGLSHVHGFERCSSKEDLEMSGYKARIVSETPAKMSTKYSVPEQIWKTTQIKQCVEEV